MGTSERQPRSRRSWNILLASALLAAFAFAAMMFTSGAAETQADVALDAEEQAFMQLLNDYRAENGLGPIIVDPSLQDAAEWLSTDMGENNYFSHTDSLGRSPWDRMCDFSYCHNTWKGENIAAGYATGAAVFDGWRNSPGHNSNMLGTHYVVMGLARVHTPGSTYGWYWTNDFGGLQVAPSPPPAPTNTPSPPASSTPSPSPSPTAPPAPSPTATPSSTPTPTPAPATSQPTASPSPTGTPYTPEAAADIDCDTHVTGLDSLTLLLFLAGLSDWDDSCPPLGSEGAHGASVTPVRGDVNCTGTITSADALSILRYAAGDVTAVRTNC